MTENEYQHAFLDLMAEKYPNRVFVPHLQLRYDIGNYSKGKTFGMPDTILDVVEFDENNDFHLWELKLIDSNELWTGKFFGQMMLYNFLFATEPWNELCGRFSFAGKKPDFKGDLGRVLMHLASYGKGEVAEEGDSNASFKSWNLCVCGGSGYELAAGYNPVSWSFWIIADEYFEEAIPSLNIWHLFPTDESLVLSRMTDLSVHDHGSLHPQALVSYLALEDGND
jgi:hypothetical protein